MSIVCIYIYFQSGELLIVPLGIKMDYNGLQYNYDKQSIAQYTALNKDESKLNHYCNSFGENLSLYMK